MNKTTRRILAVVLSLAMLLTSVTWPNITVKAAESTTVTALKAPTAVALYDYHQTGEGYVVKFTDNDASLTLAEGDTKVFEVYLGEVYVGSVKASGDTIETLENKDKLSSGTQYKVTVKEVLTRTNAAGGTDTLEAASTVANYINYNDNKILDNGIAKVFVNTSRTESNKNFDLFTNPDKTKIDAAIMVVDEKGVSQVKGTDSGTIARRGNSTGGGQKKPYNIKFESKQNLFGYGKAKKWSLLANTFDKSLIRNQTGITFHNYVEEHFQDHQYTSLGEVVDFYVDGYYLGTYYLLESVEAGGTRVDIDAENEDSVNNEILLELDSTGRDLGSDAHLRKKDEAAYETKLAKSGYYFTINAPEGPGKDGNDPDTVEERDAFWEDYWDKSDYAYNYLTAFEEEISKGANSNFNTISKMIDVDSFVNYYITAELFKITDVAFSSVRHYIKETDGGIYDETTDKSYKLYAGPLWDLDLSSGNDANTTVEGLHAQDNYWFGQLMKNATFKDLVRERYEELLPKIKEIYAEGGAIDTIIANSQDSIDANYSVAYNVHVGDAAITPVTGYGTGWKVDQVYDSNNHAGTAADMTGVTGSKITYATHAEYVEDFREWMEGRNEYLMKQFGAADKDAVYTEYEDMISDRFYNLALNKETTLYKNCREGAQVYLNNGLLTDGYCALSNGGPTGDWGTTNAPTYFTVDLGAMYEASAIDEIFIQYKDGADNDTVLNRPYQVQFSMDGSEYYDVVSVESASLNSNNRTIDELALTEGYVRYVRVYYPRQANYGMQIREFAILDTDKDAKVIAGDTIPTPTVTATTTDTYYEIKGTITANAAVAEGTTYAIYLNGSKVKTVNQAGDFTLTVEDAGTYELTVKAVANGWESEATEAITLDVVGDPEIEEAKNWVEIEKKGPDSGTIYNTYYFSKADYDKYVNTAIWGVYAPASETAYHGAGCNITGAAIAFANKNDGNMKKITVNGVEYEAGSSMFHARGDSCEMSLDAFKLEEGKSETVYTVVVEGNTTTTFKIKVKGFAITGEVSDISAPGSLNVGNYAKYTGKYFVAFTPSEGAVSYDVYVDNVFIKNIESSGQYITSEELTAAGIENGNKTLAVRAIDENGLGSYAATAEITVEDKGNADDIPQIYITTNGGKPITGEYFEKQEGGAKDVSIAIIDNTGKYDEIIESAGDIKIRGNTTAGGDKKPYNFKLSSKQKVLGMDKSKKWSLLANAFDKSLIRNALAMELANELGLQYNSEYRFVDVYVNGSYDGSYTVIESVETGDGRVEIDAEDETTEEVLLELDTTLRDAWESYHLPTTSLGVNLMFNEPELGPNDTEDIAKYQSKIDSTNALIAKFEAALVANDYDEIVKYIDVESFAKFYIVGEFFRNQDFNFSSTRFYTKTVDGVTKIYGGPGWDFDLSSGNIGNYYAGDYIDGVTYNSFIAQNMTWYRYLMNNETFKQTVIDMYSENQKIIKSIYTTKVEELMDTYGNSFERNYTSKDELGAGWSVQYRDNADNYSYATNAEWETYEESVTFLTDWLENRNEWLLEQWGIEEESVVSDDIDITGFQMTTALGGVDGTIGLRTVYQAEPTVEGQEVTEIGLVYGWDNGQITDDDMIIDSENTYVMSKAATDAGKLKAKMGESDTATYYAMTMDIATGYTESYRVRVYAKLADNSVVYSDVVTYNVLDIAKKLYQDKLMTTGTAHDAIYEMITKVEPEYAKVDYTWGNTLVDKPETAEGTVKIEGFQMTNTLGGVNDTLGLRVVYSVEGDFEEVGLIYGLAYNNRATEDDMTLENAEDETQTYVLSYPATNQGLMEVTFGSSETATYYARTMNITGLNSKGCTADYMVRAYAKDAEGNVTYSDVYTYNVNDVASQIYDNAIMSTYSGHTALYDNILTKVDPDYEQVEYNWNASLVK